MTAFHESVKTILAEVEKFLVETLKKEKLSSASKDHKQQILDQLNKLSEDYPQLKSTTSNSDESTKSRQDLDKIDDESTRTGGSSNADSAEDPYIDQGIPDIAATDHKDVIRAGYLEKKQKKGLLNVGKLQKRYCVIKGTIFYYYEKEKDKKQKGAFHLTGYELKLCPDLVKDANKKECCFELFTGEKRVYQFVASSKEDLEAWKMAVYKANGAGDGSIEFDDGDEDIYEPIDDQIIPPPVELEQDDFYTDPTEEEKPGKTEEAEDDDNQDIYEDTDTQPTTPKQKELPKIPTPVTTPKRKELPKIPDISRTEDLEQDEEYTDVANTISDAPNVPDRPPPKLPDTKAPELPGRGGRSPRLPPPPIPPDGTVSSEPLPPPPPSMDLPPVPQESSPKPETKKRKIFPREQDFENLFYGLWDCTADRSNELSFKKGDLILIINRDFDHKSWWVGELKGKYGLVPKDYLINAYTPATA